MCADRRDRHHFVSGAMRARAVRAIWAAWFGIREAAPSSAPARGRAARAIVRRPRGRELRPRSRRRSRANCWRMLAIRAMQGVRAHRAAGRSGTSDPTRPARGGGASGACTLRTTDGANARCQFPARTPLSRQWFRRWAATMRTAHCVHERIQLRLGMRTHARNGTCTSSRCSLRVTQLTEQVKWANA